MGQENFKQFRKNKIRLYSRMKLRNIFPGEWESILRGDGIDFAAIKPFEPGDDLRELNLHTLVQSGEEEIIQRVVGRQMKIFVWVDLSGSMRRSEEMFFSGKPEIRDIAVGLLLFSAWNAYSPVGLCAFDREILRFFPARSGERFCDQMLEWMTGEEYKGAQGPADIQKAISFLIERVSTRSLVFFVSDFQNPAFEGDFTALFRPVARRHDFVPVVIRDPLEKEVTLKRPVSVTVKDDGSHRTAEIDLTPKKLGEIQLACSKHLLHLGRTWRQAGIEYLVLDSPSVENCYQVLSGFFQARRRTRG